ncbi:MAG: hypothetical protein AB7S80_10740 [Rhizobiaceae bacterium]
MHRIALGLVAVLAVSAGGEAHAASAFERWDRQPTRMVAERKLDALERRGAWLYYNGYRGVADYQPGHRLLRGYWFPAQAFLDGGIVTGAIGGRED